MFTPEGKKGPPHHDKKKKILEEVEFKDLNGYTYGEKMTSDALMLMIIMRMTVDEIDEQICPSVAIGG